LPRPSPFTQADIEDRRLLTGLPKFARPAAKGDVQPEDVLTPTEIASIEAEVKEEIFKELTERPGITDEMRHVARNWNFSAAIEILGVRLIEDCRRCEDELILICVVNKLSRRAEAQETPGRKARALQLAPRWQKQRTQEQKRFWRKRQRLWRKLRNADKKLAEQALWLWKREAHRLWEQRPWLPQSLEQEAIRILESLEQEALEQEALEQEALEQEALEQEAVRRIPSSRDDFTLLQQEMKRRARRGGHESWALRNTIHALQACAATWNKNLIWDKNRRAPPKRLLNFLVQVLRAAKIKHPNPETSYAKFVSLMLRPRKPTERKIERPPKQRPSKVERSKSVPLSPKRPF
jgi:hypothetical protein